MTNLQPGREMDAAVTAALGWTIGEHNLVDRGSFLFAVGIVADADGMPGWAPSQCDRDAFAALDAFMAKHPEWDYTVASLHEGGRVMQTCGIYDQVVFVHTFEWVADEKSPTRPEAISRAILAAAEAER